MTIYKKSAVRRILILFVCCCFLIIPFRSVSAFWPFKKKPNSTPSDELTLILNVGKADLAEKMGVLREGGDCESAALELALWKLTDLTSKGALDRAWKTFVDIEKTLLGGLAKTGAGEIWEIIKSVGKTKALDEFDEKMADRKKKEKKNEQVVASGKTGTGCEYKMTVDWLKQEKRVHVVMEGDCHCKLQNTAEYRASGTPVPLSKFRVEFDIGYYYTEVEYSPDGETFYKVFGPAGGLKDIENPDDFPCFKIGYDGKGEKEGQCGCKNGEPLPKKEVSMGSDVVMNKDISVDKETLEEIMIGISTSTTPPEKEKAERLEQEKGFKRLIFEFLRRLKKRDIEDIGRGVSEKDKEAIEEEASKKKEAEALKKAQKLIEAQKEEVKKDKKETPKVKTVVPQKPVEEKSAKPTAKPVEKPIQKLIEEVAPEQDACGDGKITGMEICDGSLFSKMCLDAVAEYKAGMGNPNLVPRCFNNCRGCEASASGF